MANKKIIYQGKFIRYIKENDYEYMQRHNCSGIIIVVALTDDQKVIFVEQFRLPVNKKVIEFPAGLVGDNSKKESYITAAKRELFEEAGYKAEKIKKLISGPVSGGSSADIVTMVQAVGLVKAGKGGGDDTEDIVIHEVSISRVDSWLKQMERKGRLIEPKIYTGLYFLKEYNKRLKNQKMA